MRSIINSIYNYVGKPNVPFFKEKEGLDDIFLSKFKNLLDDYIVNYQIKYLFYFLFILFFSTSSFLFIEFFTNDSAGVLLDFLVDLITNLSNINIINFLYNFFVFNLDSVNYFFILLGNHSRVVISFVLLFFFFIFLIKYNTLKDHSSLRLLVFFYFVYSFFFFLNVYIGVFSFEFYIFFTLVLLFIYPVLATSALIYQMDKLDFFIILFISLFVFLPYYFIFFLLVIVVYCFVAPVVKEFITDKSDFDEDESLIIYVEMFLIGTVNAFILLMGTNPLFFVFSCIWYFLFILYYVYKDSSEQL